MMRALCLCLLLMACGTTASAPPEPDCSNPRGAADSLLVWQQPQAFDLKRATQCVEGPSNDTTQRHARKLKRVLDARGLYVPIAAMSDDPEYVDALGNAEVRPLGSRFPLLLRRGADGQWRYAAETLEQAPIYYDETFSGIARFLQDWLPPAFLKPVGPVAGWQLVFALLLAGLSWIVGQGIRRLLHARVGQLAIRLGAPLDQAVYARTNSPLVALASLWVLSWGLPQLDLPLFLSTPLALVLAVAVRLAVMVTLLRFLEVVVDVGGRIANRTESKLDDQLIPMLRQAMRLLVYGLGALAVAEAVGMDVWKLLAGVSLGSLAFALAAQDTVANLFGSVNVFLDRPFQIGDWVQIGDVEGVVEEVGFRSTRIRTFHNSQVTVPNSKLTNANVDNMGRRPRRRVKMTLSLTYDTPPDHLQAYVEGVRAILAAHPAVEPTYEVHLYALGASSIDILVYYHLVVPGWHEELAARSQNILEFLRLADSLGVGFAFPSSSLYVESTPERPLQARTPMSPDEMQQLVDSFAPGGDASRPEGPRFERRYRAQDLE